MKVRKNSWVVCVTVIIACAVHLDGCREIIGVGIGESEAKAFWLLQNRYLPQHAMAEIDLAAETEVIEALLLSV